MAITKSISFNGRTQDEVERKYMQWHKDSGRRVHVIKMHPVERLDSGLPGRQTPAHDEEFMMLVEYEEQLRAEPPEPLTPRGGIQ
jgi:hypothetical protein